MRLGELMTDELLTGTSKFVANGNDQAYMKAHKGDVAGALKDLDSIRDEALRRESDPHLRNEIECRRLERRLFIAAEVGTPTQFAQFVRDVGNSNRFNADRLHHLVDLIGVHIEDRFARAN